MFTFLLALAFSLAVCALIGLGFTTGFNRLVEYVQDRRSGTTAER